MMKMQQLARKLAGYNPDAPVGQTYSNIEKLLGIKNKFTFKSTNR